MMKFIIVSILFTCVFAATFSNWCIIFAYTINQQYISKELCINKYDPPMHCKGHCYLNQQLAKEEKPASPLNTKSNEKFEIQIFCISLPSSFSNSHEINKTHLTQQQNFTPQSFISSSFRPPQA